MARGGFKTERVCVLCGDQKRCPLAPLASSWSICLLVFLLRSRFSFSLPWTLRGTTTNIGKLSCFSCWRRRRRRQVLGLCDLNMDGVLNLEK